MRLNITLPLLVVPIFVPSTCLSIPYEEVQQVVGGVLSATRVELSYLRRPTVEEDRGSKILRYDIGEARISDDTKDYAAFDIAVFAGLQIQNMRIYSQQPGKRFFWAHYISQAEQRIREYVKKIPLRDTTSDILESSGWKTAWAIHEIFESAIIRYGRSCGYKVLEIRNRTDWIPEPIREGNFFFVDLPAKDGDSRQEAQDIPKIIYRMQENLQQEYEGLKVLKSDLKDVSTEVVIETAEAVVSSVSSALQQVNIIIQNEIPPNPPSLWGPASQELV